MPALGYMLLTPVPHSSDIQPPSPRPLRSPWLLFHVFPSGLLSTPRGTWSSLHLLCACPRYKFNSTNRQNEGQGFGLSWSLWFPLVPRAAWHTELGGKSGGHSRVFQGIQSTPLHYSWRNRDLAGGNILPKGTQGSKKRGATWPGDI